MGREGTYFGLNGQGDVNIWVETYMGKSQKEMYPRKNDSKGTGARAEMKYMCSKNGKKASGWLFWLELREQGGEW